MTDIDYSATQQEFEQITSNGVIDYMTDNNQRGECWVVFHRQGNCVVVARNAYTRDLTGQFIVAVTGESFLCETAQKVNAKLRELLGLEEVK